MRYKRFIIVEDDPIGTFLAKHALETTVPDSDVVAFDDSLEFLQHVYDNLFPEPTCVLLDINLPKLNGWQVLERLEQLPLETRRRYTITILTSSNHPRDLEEAWRHASVMAYWIKPLMPDTLKEWLRTDSVAGARGHANG